MVRLLRPAPSLQANAGSSASFPEMVTHLKKVASWQVRNVGSVTGNLMMARSKKFASDIATVLMAVRESRPQADTGLAGIDD